MGEIGLHQYTIRKNSPPPLPTNKKTVRETVLHLPRRQYITIHHHHKGKTTPHSQTREAKTNTVPVWGKE